MNSLIYSKNKEALIYNTAVLDSLKAICYPIFNILGFSHFGYIKNFKDGSYLYLCSNPSWLEHHYNKGNTECVDFAKMKRSMITEDIFQSCKWPKEKGNDSIGKLYDFDMWHGLELYYKSEQCIENFYFSSTCNKEISEDFYKKYLSVLKHFVFYLVLIILFHGNFAKNAIQFYYKRNVIF